MGETQRLHNIRKPAIHPTPGQGLPGPELTGGAQAGGGPGQPHQDAAKDSLEERVGADRGESGAWGSRGQRRGAGGRGPGHGGAGTDTRPCGQETSGGGHGTHSRALAWRIPWTAGAGGLQSMGSQRVRHDQATHTHRRLREREVF